MELAPALTFDTGDQLHITASSTSRPAVEAAAGASHECATIPAGHSKCIRPADAAGAENHGRITGATAPALSPQTFSLQPLAFSLPDTQPVQDIPAYLATRGPAAHYTAEDGLFITLPDAIKAELRALLGNKPGLGAFNSVQRYIKRGSSVSRACALAYPCYAECLIFGLVQFRAKYDLYRQQRDWVCLVNCAKAGPDWQTRNTGLSDAFLAYVETRRGEFRRKDGMRQAIMSIHRQWETGRTPKGQLEPIAGYQEGWTKRNPQILPEGWHPTNIRRQIEKRARLTRPVLALLQISSAAAKELLPHHLTSRAGLRFLERVTFDDVRTDWLIFDTESGQPCELWLLVARDYATGMVLGYVMHPCLVRADGTVTHLGLKQMKQLVAWILERYPMPPYVSHWTIERGTATIAKGDAAALAEMLPGCIEFHFTSMIGGKSPAGYQEKKKGNSRAKASHESHNRLFHTQGCFLPGQTGNRWDIRPADLQARCDEAVEVWGLRNRLPEHLRGQEAYPLLLHAQARQYLTQFCIEQNFRTDHAMEGFEKVLEWYDPGFDNGKDKSPGAWRPQCTYTPHATRDTQFRTRMERPVERAITLMAPYAGQWTKCSPDVIITFLSHTVRQITRPQIKANGEITFRYEGSPITFAPPQNHQLSQLSTALGYFSPDDPAFLHVTDGKGRVLGTWYRRARLGYQDQDLLAQAMRYTDAAFKAVQQAAVEVTAPERADLDAMRLHNSELERGNEFVEIANPQSAIRNPQSEIHNPVAAALAAIPRARRQAEDTQAADEQLASTLGVL